MIFIAVDTAKRQLVYVGFADDPNLRVMELNAILPLSLELIGSISVKSNTDAEKMVNDLLNDQRLQNGWFRLTPEQAANDLVVINLLRNLQQLPKPQGRQKAVDPRVSTVIRKFREMYRNWAGYDYPVNYPREAKMIKNLPQSYNTALLLRAVEYFFMNPDDWWFKNAGVTLPVFVRRLPVIIPKLTNTDSAGRPTPQTPKAPGAKLEMARKKPPKPSESASLTF